MANNILQEIGNFIGGRFGQLKRTAFTNSYNDLDGLPSIPVVPEWAKQSQKPEYTASEVGAIPQDKENDLMKKSRILTYMPPNPQDGDIYINT